MRCHHYCVLLISFSKRFLPHVDGAYGKAPFWTDRKKESLPFDVKKPVKFSASWENANKNALRVSTQSSEPSGWMHEVGLELEPDHMKCWDTGKNLMKNWISIEIEPWNWYVMLICRVFRDTSHYRGAFGCYSESAGHTYGCTIKAVYRLQIVEGHYMHGIIAK